MPDSLNSMFFVKIMYYLIPAIMTNDNIEIGGGRNTNFFTRDIATLRVRGLRCSPGQISVGKSSKGQMKVSLSCKLKNPEIFAVI